VKRVPRFVLDRIDPSAGLVCVRGAELHHMRDVMRLRRDSQVALIANDGTEYIGLIESIGASHAEVRLLQARKPTAGCAIVLAVATIKGFRMDFIVEKGAELGAGELWPIECARGEVHSISKARLERWRRLATAAAKQGLASVPMQIREPIGFSAMLATASNAALRLICQIGAAPIAPVVRAARPSSIVMVCGPEGDFTSEEIAAANNAGFVSVGLGDKRLRSETAAMAALSIAIAALAETNGESEQ